MTDFEINEAALRRVEKDLAKKLGKQVSVPLTGPESAAVLAVKKQIAAMGATVNSADLRRIVRNARKS